MDKQRIPMYLPEKMLLSVFFLIPSFCFSQTANEKKSFRFDFGHGKVSSGWTQILSTSGYTKEVGYGFFSTENLKSTERKGKDALNSDFITSDHPFYFTIDLPEGNYDVAVYIGDKEGTSATSVRAECRRLMVDFFETRKGEVVKKEFTVNVRSSRIGSSSDSVRLKSREKNYLHWDNQLTLEFSGSNSKVTGLEITKTDKPITIFLSGNSTVVDQPEEPFASWGQIIPVFFKPYEIAIANYAESGESLKSFENANRFAKILSLIKPGDYLFIEFAHNDQKPGPYHLDAFTTYKETLKSYINSVRSKGAFPVLVTSMHRRKFDEQGKIINTLEDFPEAVRQTGREENVPVIDLHAMSQVLYEAMGVEKSLKAFVHYPAGTFPGQQQELKDNSHFSPYGAYQLAKCVVEGIKMNDLPIAKYLVDDLPKFDPAKPDPVDAWYWPLSLQVSSIKPDGN